MPWKPNDQMTRKELAAQPIERGTTQRQRVGDDQMGAYWSSGIA